MLRSFEATHDGYKHIVDYGDSNNYIHIDCSMYICNDKDLEKLSENGVAAKAGTAPRPRSRRGPRCPERPEDGS